MNEAISALMDGELEGRAADDALEHLRRDGEAANAWRLYHLMSDAMHGQRQVLSARFVERVAARLATEPAVLSPGALPGRTPLQRYALAAAASLAAVALVGWLAFAPQPQPQPAVAQAQPGAVTVSLPDAANDYLLAHQGFSPRMSLLGMAPYVRTVAERADESAK
ncbi:MAG TPA: sigma-E factor negative regulatory protein [Burkholderiales bacterium]|nr:sigma-E factor negative regulatory protein [Burkholderiales bacterium]